MVVTNFITWPCKQKATYWPPGSEESGGRDYDDFGNPMYASPIEIKCRWDDTTEETVTAEGTVFTSIAQVIVDYEVAIKGVLLLSEIINVSDLTVPKNNLGAGEIRRVTKNPNIPATKYLVMAYL
jgi:hypothetical protein